MSTRDEYPQVGDLRWCGTCGQLERFTMHRGNLRWEGPVRIAPYATETVRLPFVVNPKETL